MMRLRVTTRLCLAYLCILFLTPGCAKGPTEKLLPVKGTVTVEGKPVWTGNVTFYPDKGKGNETMHQPIGTLDASGNYEMVVPGGRKGAPAGAYKVVVYAVDDPQPGKPNKYLANKDYASADTTSLRIEVVDDPEPGRYDFKLTK
jgi:hypothetical protein